MIRALRWLIDDAPSVQEVIDELTGRLACAIVTKEQSLGLAEAGRPRERYAAAGLDLASFKPLDDWQKDLHRQPVRPPSELADLAVGDTRRDMMGREWTVLDVLDDGVVIQYDDGEPREFKWHALMTIGAGERLPFA